MSQILSPQNDKIDRIRDLYELGGLNEVIRGIRDYLYYHPYKMIYLEYLSTRYGPYYDIDLGEYVLTVDLRDKGISQSLAWNGIKEPVSYAEYKSALDNLSSEDDELIVLEVGANIGYYALLPPSLRDDIYVYAAELDESNTELLQRNVRQNKVTDKLTIENIALSNKTGTGIVQKSNQSNLHSLNKRPDNSTVTGTEEIPIIDTREWIQAQGLVQSDIDVIRMDIEGSESDVLQSLDNIEPELVHIEVHPRFMPNEEWEYVCNRLKQFDLEVQCISNGVDDLKAQGFTLSNIPSSEIAEIVLHNQS